MNTEYRQYLRMSPYLQTNLVKYQPNAIIPEQNTRNQLQIPHKNMGIGSFISYSNYQPEQMAPLIEEECYFCKAISSVVNLHSRCSECKKVMCQGCRYVCGRCGRAVCQLDRRYDYSNECESCFDCS